MRRRRTGRRRCLGRPARRRLPTRPSFRGIRAGARREHCRNARHHVRHGGGRGYCVCVGMCVCMWGWVGVRTSTSSVSRTRALCSSRRESVTRGGRRCTCVSVCKKHLEKKPAPLPAGGGKGGFGSAGVPTRSNQLGIPGTALGPTLECHQLPYKSIAERKYQLNRSGDFGDPT
jgi:hypothetical protein